jgi:hypothetical protein
MAARPTRRAAGYTSAVPNDKVTPEQAVGLKFIEKMNGELLPLFQRSVLPLFTYAPEHDHARFLASAHLVAVAGRHFLVSASHALQGLLDGGQQDDLYVPNRFSGSFVALEGPVFGDESNEHDFAFMELRPQAVEALRGHRFLSLADVDLSTEPLPAGWYYIHGYPQVGASSSRGAVEEHRARPFTHSTSPYRGPTSFLPTFIPRNHVLLEVDPNRTGDTRGEDADVPRDLKGISGSAIWRSFSYGEDASTWTSADARVVAVETCVVLKDGRLLVRGTRWFVVLALMRNVYPDLAPAIALHNPPRVRAKVRWRRDSD